MDRDGVDGHVRVAIEDIQTYDGHQIIPPRSGVTVVVGANNAGKSTFLREIMEWISTPNPAYPPHTKVVARCNLDVVGAQESIIENLRNEGAYFSQGRNESYRISGTVVPANQITMQWKWATQGRNILGPLAPYFVHYVNAVNRGGGIAPPSRRSDIGNPPESPMHKLEDDAELLERIKGVSRRIFRQTLTLDRLSNNVQLRVGEPSIPAPSIDNITREYRDALVSLEPLQDQGDGMTAVLGLLVPIICGSHNVALVDEPEAFLHPPQARIVGALLGELAQERDMQILVATHDRNILVGLLQSQVPVSVIRMDRRTSPTKTHLLDFAQVRNLWDDPILRYSNILDGLFHHAVVLCEAERDCTFYSASLDFAAENRALNFSPGDILFVSTGGKDGFPDMVRSLKAVSVPVVVIPDIDLLDDKGKTRSLVEVMHGDWSSIESNYDIATSSFRRPRKQIRNSLILDSIRSVLEPISEGIYDRNVEEAVKAALRSDPSPWGELKKFGIGAARGQEYQSMVKVMDGLQQCGIVVVQRGELENLAPSVVSKKGKRWLSEALEKEAFKSDEAQAHISHVINTIQQQLLPGLTLC